MREPLSIRLYVLHTPARTRRADEAWGVNSMKALFVRSMRVLLLFLLLVIAWLFWSGLFTPLLIILGVVSCMLTSYLALRMRYFGDETFALRQSPRLITYLAWIVKEIFRSSLEVTRVVLDPRLPISTRIIEIDASALHSVDQVILGNSITLTPGTLAIDVHQGVIKVHCLTEEDAIALTSGDMYSRVAALRKS